MQIILYNKFCSKKISKMTSSSSLRKYDHILAAMEKRSGTPKYSKAAIYTYIYTVVATHHCCPQRHLCHRSLSSTSSITYYCYRYLYPRPHHPIGQNRLRQPRLKSSTELKKLYNYEYKIALLLT